MNERDEKVNDIIRDAYEHGIPEGLPVFDKPVEGPPRARERVAVGYLAAQVLAAREELDDAAARIMELEIENRKLKDGFTDIMANYARWLARNSR